MPSRCGTGFPGNRMLLRSGGVGLPFFGEELPHIPGHVEQSISIRGILTDRRGRTEAAAREVRASAIHGLITPGKERVEAAAGRVLPLCLGGQALSRPSAKGHGCVPIYINYRMVCLGDERRCVL